MHTHEFLNTFIRDGKWVIFSGELETDEQIKLCDCGAKLNEDGSIEEGYLNE